MVFENREEEKDLKSRNKGKEDHSHSQQIKLNNFTISLLDMRKEVLYPISIAIEADLAYYKKLTDLTPLTLQTFGISIPCTKGKLTLISVNL